jgi:tetratricopeptide (TPR) repeat protein
LSLDTLQTSSALGEHLDSIGQAFLVEFYEVVTRRQPDNLEALAEFAQALTRQGHWERGLELDRRLARILPEDPTIQYNLSCSLALTQRTLESLEALEQAIVLGYDDVDYLLDDPDLESLRRHTRFQELVRRLRLSNAY